MVAPSLVRATITPMSTEEPVPPTLAATSWYPLTRPAAAAPTRSAVVVTRVGMTTATARPATSRAPMAAGTGTNGTTRYAVATTGAATVRMRLGRARTCDSARRPRVRAAQNPLTASPAVRALVPRSSSR